jgi:hypothetical protein
MAKANSTAFVKTDGASASVSHDSYTLCQAIDLLDEAAAVALFVTLASDDRNECETITETEKRGFHIVMSDMLDRIKKASSLVDEYREGVSYD